MNFSLYKASKDNFKFIIKALILFCVLLGLMNAYLLIIYTKAATKTNYIVVPPGINTPTYIGDEYVDRKYVLAMGVYVANLLLTYTPDNIEANINRLLLLAAPETKGIIKEELSREVPLIKNKKIAQTFAVSSLDVVYFKTKKDLIKQMEGIVVSPIKGEIDIKGVLARRIGVSPPIWKGDISVKIRYMVRNGMFQVLGFEIKTEKNNVTRG